MKLYGGFDLIEIAVLVFILTVLGYCSVGAYKRSLAAQNTTSAPAEMAKTVNCK